MKDELELDKDGNINKDNHEFNEWLKERSW